MTNTDVVERRITRALADLTEPRPRDGQHLSPPPCVRQHFAEHAAAAGVLNDTTIPDGFLPYLDPYRLRSAIRYLPSPVGLTALPLRRRVSHQWDWHRPEVNDAALRCGAP